ncbi:MAG: phenylalanine--tRNA ligase subunit beta [Polyangiaceae bacterium]|nr:phenylalanine--tRNA ligase subunit beta [Polyangiaceae bacterium]
MKASYNWIRALCPGLSLSAKELASRLTFAGLEVEGLIEYGAGTEPLVVAEVRKIEPHPSRPKLRLVTVDRGGSEQRIVCGAPNVPDPGGLVALAPLGTHLPAVNMTLTPREIGGIVSEGMLCSERELGLGSAASNKSEDPGILILPAKIAPAGTPLRKALPSVHDFILDINVTPNRPDVLGHVGLARETAALCDLPWSFPTPDAPARFTQSPAIGDLIRVTIEDLERCPAYGAAAVIDVALGPSPLWLKYRLESLGIRSISNVVDITNLVMLELGHPIHAFDLDLLRGGQIIVRRAKEGEFLTTLDGVKRTLVVDDLVIADAEGPVALAGVMGGEGSEIRATTKRVLIECAYFAPRGVRRTGRRHGLHSESSYRFERGVDPSTLPDVLAQAASLVTHLAGGTGVKGTIIAGQGPEARAPITLREERITRLLGTSVPFTEATKILSKLGCELRSVAGDSPQITADVVPPHHRPDIHMEADLIEEVMRVRGIDAIPSVLPPIRPSAPRRTLELENKVRREAAALGLAEALTYAFVSNKDLEALGAPKPAVVIKNPLTEDRNVMRTSLLPGLLQALSRSRRHGEPDVRMFAVGARLLPRSSSSPDLEFVEDSDLPDEIPSFAAVIAGSRYRPLEKPLPVDIYDAKGVALELVERVTKRRASCDHQAKDKRPSHLHPRAAAEIFVGDDIVGTFGQLHPDVVDTLDLGGPAFVIEIDLRSLDTVSARAPRFRPIPILPPVTRDLALKVPEAVTAGQVMDAIREAAGELCEHVEVFDVFRGQGVGEGQKSVAFHVIYRDPRAATDPETARTLTDEEVDKKNQAVLASVSERFGAVLRS